MTDGTSGPDVTRPTERLDFLAATPLRGRILARLAAGSRSIRDLRDDLDEPRTTIHQNVEKLTERGWVARTGDGYETTWLGDVVLEEYEAVGRHLGTARRLAPFLEHVPVSAVDLDALEGAAVTTSGPNDPHAILDRANELFQGVEEMRGFAPYLVPRFLHMSHAYTREGRLEFEVVAESDALDAAAAEYPDLLRETLETGLAAYRRYDGTLPFVLLFVADRVVLVAFDDNGLPRSLVEVDSDAAFDWAEGLYERYRAAAEPLTLADLE